MMFYTAINKNLSNGHWPINSLVQLIFFHSRPFTTVKKKYYLIKLEIISFVLVINKVKN